MYLFCAQIVLDWAPCSPIVCFLCLHYSLSATCFGATKLFSFLPEAHPAMTHFSKEFCMYLETNMWVPSVPVIFGSQCLVPLVDQANTHMCMEACAHTDTFTSVSISSCACISTTTNSHQCLHVQLCTWSVFWFCPFPHLSLPSPAV